LRKKRLALAAVLAAGCAVRREPLSIRVPDYGHDIDPEMLEAMSPQVPKGKKALPVLN